MHGLVETRSDLGRRCASDRLLQICVRNTVIQLHRLYPTKEVVVASELRISGRQRESGFRDKLVGLVVEAVVQITTQKTVYERGLGIVVVAE